VPEVVVEGSLGSSQSLKIPVKRAVLPNPKLKVFQESVAVHEEGSRGREDRSQPIKDTESVGIDIAPIVHSALLEPPYLRQPF
jgi:hypothetical protein